MATIETVRRSYYTLTDDQRRAHLVSYRNSRSDILSRSDVDTKIDLGRAKKAAPKAKAISPEVKALAKALGMSAKALLALRGEE